MRNGVVSVFSANAAHAPLRRVVTAKHGKHTATQSVHARIAGIKNSTVPVRSNHEAGNRGCGNRQSIASRIRLNIVLGSLARHA